MEEAGVSASGVVPVPPPKTTSAPPPPPPPPSPPKSRALGPPAVEVNTTRRPTAHLPPSSVLSSPSSPSDDDDPSKRTIRINIEIVIPKLLLPNYKNGRPDIDSKWIKRRLVFGFIGLLYLSFMIGQAVAWGLKESHDIERIHLPIVIVATFIPYFDLLANIWVVKLMKSDRENGTKHPSFRHAFALIVNTILILWEIVILIFGIIWTSAPYHHYWYWDWRKEKRAIAGLTIYSMSTMILMKIILAILVFRCPETFDKFRQVTAQLQVRRSSANNNDYEELAQEYYDEDARIRPGMRVSHNQDEETPRNSSEQGRILLL